MSVIDGKIENRFRQIIHHIRVADDGGVEKNSTAFVASRVDVLLASSISGDCRADFGDER